MLLSLSSTKDQSGQVDIWCEIGIREIVGKIFLVLSSGPNEYQFISLSLICDSIFFSEVLKNDFGGFSRHCATIFELQICRLVIVEYLVGEWMALASCWHLVPNR